MKDYVDEQNTIEKNKDFELSHIIGLNTNVNKCLQAHPTMTDTLLYAVGGIVVIEDLNDRNNQVYFRHGKNQINCFKISNSGKFLAVGFISDNLEKKIPSSIILWSFETKEVIYELNGIFKGVTNLEFSQDDKYLAASGLDNSLFIWQIETGYKCFNRVFEFNINLLQWTYIFVGKGYQDANFKTQIQNSNNSNVQYFLTIANVNIIHYVQFYYDSNSGQYFTNFNRFNLPSTGYNRIYTSSVCDLNNRVLYMGTSGGELSSFNLDNLYFKSSFNVINSGVSSLIYSETSDCIIIAGGDGKIKKMIFMDGKQVLTHEIQLSSKIISLTQGTDIREFYAATKNGEVLRILIDDFTYTLHSVSFVSALNSCDYFKDRNDICLTCDDLVKIKFI